MNVLHIQFEAVPGEWRQYIMTREWYRTCEEGGNQRHRAQPHLPAYCEATVERAYYYFGELIEHWPQATKDFP